MAAHPDANNLSKNNVAFLRWLPRLGRNTYTVGADLKGADRLRVERSAAQQMQHNKPVTPWGQYSHSIRSDNHLPEGLCSVWICMAFDPINCVDLLFFISGASVYF